MVRQYQKHGMTHTPEYRHWIKMKMRCKKDSDAAQYYYNRGITVAEAWINDFHRFYKDLGKRPTSKHTLDRIDNNKGYFAENCRWATRAQQTRNSRNTKLNPSQVHSIRILSKCEYTIRELAKMFGVSHQTICSIKNRKHWR